MHASLAVVRLLTLGLCLGLAPWPAGLAAGKAAAIQEAADEAWPMFRGNPERTGTLGTQGPQGDAVDLIWPAPFPAKGPIRSSPAVVDGIVYVGSDDGNLYAVDASTGDLIWSAATGAPVVSSPAVDGDLVYVGSADFVLAYNRFDGSLVWSVQVGGPVDSSPAVADAGEDRAVFVAGLDQTIYALDAVTGEEIWRASDDGIGLSSPAVAGGTVYAGGFGALFAYNGETGGEVGRLELADVAIDTAPAVTDDWVYFSDASGTLYAAQRASLDICWSVPELAAPLSSPAVHDDSVYVATGTGVVAVVETAECPGESSERSPDWEREWAGRASAPVSSPVVDDRLLYVGDGAGTLHALDHTRRGVPIWEFATGGAIDASAAIAGGVVYVGSADQNLYALGVPPATAD